MMHPLLIETVGAIAACCTTLCWVPQAVRIIRTRDAKAISLWTQAVFTFGLVLWLAYGVLLGSFPLIVANTVTFALAATILVLKIRLG
jgi:MtN3 and saliva related transmembrane protein